jgi:ZIP family zinc transporter
LQFVKIAIEKSRLPAGVVLAALAVELLLEIGREHAPGLVLIGSFALGVTVLVFSMFGNLLLTGASHAVIGGTLAFSAAALLYLVTQELLMEAHEVEEKPISTLVLFGGFLAFWSIQLMGR